MRFKTPRQKIEYGEVDFKLQRILTFIDLYVILKHGMEITITELKRSQEEQDAIYLNANDKLVRLQYERSPWKSVHQYGRGADIRTFDLPKHVKNDILELLNRFVYDEERPDKKTAIFHDLGTGEHIHVQVKANA